MFAATSSVRHRLAFAPLALACLFLIGCENTDDSPSGKSEGTADEAAPAESNPELLDKTRLDAELGPWRVSQMGSMSITATSADKFDAPEATAMPVAGTALELQVHMLGTRLDNQLSDQEFAKAVVKMFLQIPGVPLGPRYQDARYDKVRSAFTSECTSAVQGYQRLLIDILSAPASDFSMSIFNAQHSRAASSYETECLTALANVPLTIRQVVGVLVVGGRPFCSATIIGDKDLLTSRHCFVDSDSGDSLITLDHWRDGNVSFVPATMQNSRSAFSVAPPNSAELQAIQNKFDAPADYLRLSTMRSMQYAAVYKPAPAPKIEYPVTAWLVGSNIHLDDIGQAGAPLDFVRGAAPNACALLEKTPAGCVYHTCQTSPSTSGAGMLIANTAGKVELLAIHKGTIAEAMTCETSPPQSLLLNLAISDISI